MAENFEDKLPRIRSKMALLLERYKVLETRLQELDEACRKKDAENRKLRKEIDTLKTDLEYSHVVRAFANSPEQLAQSRAILYQLVRDVDKCIAQLKQE